MNKKINKRNCEDNLGGSFIEEEECTQEMMNQAGIGKFNPSFVHFIKPFVGVRIKLKINLELDLRIALSLRSYSTNLSI